MSKTEEVLDPVVGVGPATGRGPICAIHGQTAAGGAAIGLPASQPRPPLEQLVAGQPCRCLRVRRTPREYRLAQNPLVDGADSDEYDGCPQSQLRTPTGSSSSTCRGAATGTPSSPRTMATGRLDSDKTPRETLPSSADLSVP